MKWQAVPIGQLVKQITRSERVDTAKSYRLLGVRLDGAGPFHRETKTGAQSSASTLSRVEEGDFIYSRLFAWRGAFGLIPAELDGSYVSNEFPTFACDPERLDPRYLDYFFRLRPTLAEVEEKCTGSTPLTRNRFKEQFFLALNIPLPPLAEQRRLVSEVERAARLIADAWELSRGTEAEVNALLDSGRRSMIGERPDSTWLPLSYYVERIENGRSPQCEPHAASAQEWGVLKVGAVSFGKYDQLQNKAVVPGFVHDPSHEVIEGDFIMSRANTAELVGACAIVRATRPRLLLSDKTFRLHFHAASDLTKNWLEHVMKSPALRTQIQSAASGTSPTMKNISKEKVLGLRVPPHDLCEQRRVVSVLDALQARVSEIKRLQAESAKDLDALLPSILHRAFRGDL